MEEPATAIPTESKKPNRIGLLGGVALVLVLVLGGIWLFLRQSPVQAKQQPRSDPEVKVAIPLDEFIVNLADSEGGHYLRVGIEVGLVRALPGVASGENQAFPKAPMRDTILAVLSTWHSDELLSPAGKIKLKEDLVRALQERIPELGVKEIYFTDFLVQR